MQGDLRHRSLGKPETYGDHINGDLLLRTRTSWVMWCCSTIFTVWYLTLHRLKSQKSVYHAGVHLMYWEYRSFCSHLWVFLCWSSAHDSVVKWREKLPSLHEDWQCCEKNAGESRAHSVPVLMGVEISHFLCHQYFLWSCIKDRSEKGLWLITPSVLEGFQLSQVPEPSRIYQVWTLCSILQHPAICDWIWRQTKTQIIITCVDGKCAEQ